MDCNMDEAIRTRDLAETKLQKNDFAGARKLAMKAQQLYPNLDNIIQLLTVCDVHCASQQKIHGYEMDWYGILQIGQTADDSLIKKHYRKLALLLHPDKNKFPGAEAAFKLIGEAQRLLSDPVKRQAHDMKRRAYVKVKPPVVRVQCQPTKNQYVGRPSADAYKNRSGSQYANVNFQQQPQPPAQSPTTVFTTFVTVCPYCTTMRQARVIDRYSSVLCHVCKKSYIASEAAHENSAREKNYRKAAFAEKVVPTRGQSNASMEFEGNAHAKNSNMNCSTEADRSKGDTRNNIVKEPKKVDNKRKRPKFEAVREDTDSDSSSETDEYETFVADFKLGKDHTIGSDGDLNRRRSTRQKQKILYNESLSDDDEFLSHNDQGGKVGSVPESENRGANVRNVETELHQKDPEPPSHLYSVGCNKSQKSKREESPVDLKDLKMSCGDFQPPTASNNDAASFRCSKDNCNAAETQKNHSDNHFEDSKSSAFNSNPLEVLDPEFFTFEISRPEDEFEVGQMWAVYSDDGLPKYYVQIQSIRPSPEFELVTRWLIPCPGQGNMISWRDKTMPFGCGIFKLSRAKPKEFRPDTFSHILDPQTTGKKGEFGIFPKKGEVWALYKDWNLEMNFSDIDDFEYEVAEVLNADKETVLVLPLHHVSGHVAVFRGNESGRTLGIPKTELLRFSHQIPAFRLTDELGGTLRGYWELDPAAVPPALLSSN